MDVSDVAVSVAPFEIVSYPDPEEGLLPEEEVSPEEVGVLPEEVVVIPENVLPDPPVEVIGTKGFRLDDEDD